MLAAMITAVAFDFERRTEEVLASPDAATEACARGLYCWVDVDCSGCQGRTADCTACADLLRRLGVNDLARAEVLGADREGRYDVHEDCLHFAVTEARRCEGRLHTAHVDVVLAARYLVTFRRRDAEFIRQIRRTYREDFLKFARSPGFLLYEIGDHLLEMYRRTLREFSGAAEQVQMRLLGDVDDAIFREVSDLTQDLLVFRKVVLASRELLHELATRRSPFVSETTQPFLENLAGSLERLGSDLTVEREALAESLNLYLGMVGHRTNKVVNRLTVISTIFLPLSFLCGIYGMNLKNIPEMEWDFGYLFFWALAALIAGGLLVLMKRNRWI